MELLPHNITDVLFNIGYTNNSIWNQLSRKALNKTINNVIFMELVSSSTDHNYEPEELIHEMRSFQ